MVTGYKYPARVPPVEKIRNYKRYSEELVPIRLEPW